VQDLPVKEIVELYIWDQVLQALVEAVLFISQSAREIAALEENLYYNLVFQAEVLVGV